MYGLPSNSLAFSQRRSGIAMLTVARTLSIGEASHKFADWPGDESVGDLFVPWLLMMMMWWAWLR
jgi:hypothetical protein